jgi:hypothetical protein
VSSSSRGAQQQPTRRVLLFFKKVFFGEKSTKPGGDGRTLPHARACMNDVEKKSGLIGVYTVFTVRIGIRAEPIK